MTAIALVSVINHYHINGLHLFWDTLYLNSFKILFFSSETKKIKGQEKSFQQYFEFIYLYSFLSLVIYFILLIEI